MQQNQIQQNPRCLVLGGCGFIGSHLVDALLSRGCFVRCFDRPSVLPLSGTWLSEPNFERFEGDFVSEVDVATALDGCDVCFHLVSTTLPKSSNLDPVFDIESNVLGTVRLLSHAVRLGTKKIVFVSSGGTVYGVPNSIPIGEDHATDPTSSYGITKLTIEKYLSLFHTLHKLDYRVLRVSNPYGERQRTRASQGAVAVFLGKALRREPIEIWGDGSIVRDYIHISDVVAALVAAMDYGGDGRIFNIGSGRGLSLNEVLDAIDYATGLATQRHYVSGRTFDVPASVLRIDRALAELQWSPLVEFEEGLERYVRWLALSAGAASDGGRQRFS